ncbi:hypothetical protein I4U23_023471 [Adineta vaga]|nr:hypothetical protein I4U23_023471 [Adineta vaga]
MASHIRIMLNKIFGKPEYRALFIGLDASGKTTILYRFKLGEVVTAIPTIGFNVETIEYNDTKLTIWDVGGCDKIRPLLRHYFQNTQAMIFVIDTNDRERLHEAKDELSRLVSEEEMYGVPILFYLNKTDLIHALPINEIVEQMRMSHMRNRSYHVQPCSAINGDGLYEGLDWLISVLKSSSNRLDRPLAVELDTPEDSTTAARPEAQKSLEWLSQVDDDTDEEFIDKFQKHQLLSEQFDHRSFLRTIWSYLQLHNRKETIKAIFNHLPTYINDINETLTYFWIQIVHYAREATKNPTNDFPGFLLMNPQILNEAELPLAYYKKETLYSNEAKASVILADVKQLPSILPTANKAVSKVTSGREEQSVVEIDDDDDDEFLKQFESCTLTSWSHRTHVRMAWLYLTRDGRRTGVKKIFDGIKNFIANSQVSRKTTFHFTMTYFWIQMIDLAIAQSPKEIGFEEFLRLNPQLMNGGLFLEYYKKETMLNNPTARQEMVLPDIKPLPTLIPATTGKK